MTTNELENDIRTHFSKTEDAKGKWNGAYKKNIIWEVDLSKTEIRYDLFADGSGRKKVEVYLTKKDFAALCKLQKEQFSAINMET